MDAASRIIINQLTAENENLREALEKACSYIHCSIGRCPCDINGTCSGSNCVENIVSCLLGQN